MDIQPTNQQPISDDQELAKVLAGLNQQADEVSTTPVVPETPDRLARTRHEGRPPQDLHSRTDLPPQVKRIDGADSGRSRRRSFGCTTARAGPTHVRHTDALSSDCPVEEGPHNVATAALRPCSSEGRPSGAGLSTACFVAFLALGNFLEGILAVGFAILPLGLREFPGNDLLLGRCELSGLRLRHDSLLCFEALSRLSLRQDTRVSRVQRNPRFIVGQQLSRR